MKRKVLHGSLLALMVVAALPVAVAAVKRTTVVVHTGWPIKRPLRTVVVRPPRRPVVVATSSFLAPSVWVNAVIPLPPADRVVWQDSETLGVGDDWAEVTLNAGQHGQRLDLQLDGAAEVDFCEVVYDNGESQVVDFGNQPIAAGVYTLAELGGRKVDHARIVARATGGDARLNLVMEK